jgi:ABC-type sugar transport system ATPase subunit
MVGRDHSTTAIRRASRYRRDVVFEVKNWSVYHPIHAERQVIKGIDINVRKGEVVGIAGLMGAGRTEFAMSVFGRSYGPRSAARCCSRQEGRRPAP